MRRTISVGIVRFRSENAWSFAMSSARTEIVRRSLACFAMLEVGYMELIPERDMMMLRFSPS